MLTPAGRPCGAAARRPRAAIRRSMPATTRRRRARGRASTAAPSGSQAWPMNITSRCGRRTSASQRTRSGATDHSSSSSRVSVSTGLSPTSTAPPAPSAQRPAHDDSQGARRPASQRPSASRVTHSAATDSDASPSTRRSAQRVGCRCIVSLPSCSRVADQPRRQAVVAGRAAVAQRGDGGVGRLHARGRGVVVARRSSGPRPRRGATGRGRGGRARRACGSRSRSIGSARRWRAHATAGAGGSRTRSSARPRRGPRRPASSQALGLRLDRRRGAAALDARAAGAAGRRPGRAGRICSTDDRDRAGHASASPTSTRSARFRGRYEHVARRRRPPAPTRRRSRPPGMGRGRERRGHPLRRRHERRRRRRAAGPGHFDGAVVARPRRARRVLEVDPVSRAARIGAGARGPRLEEQLGAHGLTMRFYPQSFELSTLGGWIATRAGGHFAIGPTHVDDLVEAVRAITPTGTWASRRLPGSGAGPSPDRMLLGSEGILGVITEAWVRVQPRPSHRAGRTVRFASLPGRRRGGARGRPGRPAARQLPAASTRSRRGRPARATASARVLVLGFESDRPRRRRTSSRARSRCAARTAASADEPRGAAARRRRRLARGVPAHALPARHARAPRRPLRHLRDGDHLGALPAFHEAVVGATREALGEPCRVTCRFTHVYPDGPAPYFTVLAPARRGDEVAQWHEMKRAAGRRDPRRRRDDHPPPRRRPRPPALVRRPAPRAVRGGAARGQGRGRPRRDPQPRRPRRPVSYRLTMSAEAKNFEAITKAKADHNASCPFPPHTVRMNPFEIERMEWEEGD